MRILLSFVGNRDPYSDTEGSYGPLLSLLTDRPYDQVVLFCTGSAYLERARTVEATVEQAAQTPSFSFVNLELESVVDYEEIFTRLRDTVARITQNRAASAPRYDVLLDPGTPQMQTSWILLVRSGLFDATLLQGIPARFADGTYRVKEITFEGSALPRLELETALQNQVDDDERLPPVSPDSPETSAWINAGGRPMVGSSPVFEALLAQARQVARYDVSILLRGETGTGKNLLARYIHEASPRAHAPYLDLNCSAVTATLAESELFGHVSGAYTGATRDRLGIFRAADGGTIFLDEIGDLPLELQPKLLRVLEDRIVLPVGSDTPVPVNVRVVAATNRNLETMIDTGDFRRDLYERLKQVSLELPPLHRRPEDIAPLVDTFVRRWNHRYHEEKVFSADAVAALAGHTWPGNVRELENAVMSLCASAVGQTIGREQLAGVLARSGDTAIRDSLDLSSGAVPDAVILPPDGIDLRDLLTRIERACYTRALEHSRGNAEQAARLLGVSGHTFRKAWRERLGGGDGQ